MEFKTIKSYADEHIYSFYFEIAEIIPENQINRWFMMEDCITSTIAIPIPKTFSMLNS
ncbi:MAG: hypothetical protein ACTSYI_14700 [Promethearchaeota archaeon]